MDERTKSLAIQKLAYFGGAPVLGAPVFSVPPMTVGQAMYDLGRFSSISGMERRKALDDIVATGMNVNAPAKSLFRAGIGALAGHTVSKLFGASPFVRGMATAIGANYGYNA